MNKNVMLLAIKDLKDILIQIERKNKISESDCIKLEKEINSFLSNLSSYKLRFSVKNNKLFSAIQFAFNMIKHEKRIYEIKKIQPGGISFPITFPMQIPCSKVYWINVNNFKLDFKWKKQYENYLSKLNKKRIINTLKELEQIL